MHIAVRPTKTNVFFIIDEKALQRAQKLKTSNYLTLALIALNRLTDAVMLIIDQF